MSDSTPENKAKPKSTRIRWKSLAILFLGFSVIGLVVAVAWTGQRIFVANQHAAITIGHLEKGLTASQNTTEQTQQSMNGLQQSIQKINDDLKTQAQAIVELRQAQHANKDDLVVAEAQYLVQMANNNLQFENNTTLAIKLLQAADQEITKLTDPHLYPIREAIAADIAALQAIPQLDVAGIYARLSALSDQIERLPLVTQFRNEQVSSSPAIPETNLSWWQRGLHSTWQALQRIVVVRQTKKDELPFVTPDQQIYLLQNLQAEIEKAQWGLLHHQSDIYRASLQRAADWIKKYVTQDAPAAKEMLTNLAQLQQIDVHPAIPEVSGSLQAFQTYLNVAR